jgi:hypothetical protein
MLESRHKQSDITAPKGQSRHVNLVKGKTDGQVELGITTRHLAGSALTAWRVEKERE